MQEPSGSSCSAATHSWKGLPWAGGQLQCFDGELRGFVDETTRVLFLPDLLDGLAFHPPSGGLVTAVATFGITGVGASELVMYPYWCIEKGYARFTGRLENSDPLANSGLRLD